MSQQRVNTNLGFLQLRPFEAADYPLLVAWISNEKLTYQWAGPYYTYPLSIAQVANHCRDPDIFPYIFSLDNQPVGFAELRRQSAGYFRVCRVFIGDAFQGQGLSKHLIAMLINKAKTEFSAEHLSLCVFEHNQAALKCYQSAGFTQTSQTLGNELICDMLWTAIDMEMHL